MSEPPLPKNTSISWSKSVQKFTFGHKMIINLQDMQLFLENKERMFIEAKKDQLAKCEDLMKKRVIASVCLGAACLLSIRRYFPGYINTLTINKMCLDLGIISTSLIGGLYFTSIGIEENLQVLKKPLLLEKNEVLIEHMNRISREFGISQREQVYLAFQRDKSEIDEFFNGLERKAAIKVL